MLAQKLWAVSALVTQDTVCYKAKSASGCLDMELNAKYCENKVSSAQSAIF